MTQAKRLLTLLLLVCLAAGPLSLGTLAEPVYEAEIVGGRQYETLEEAVAAVEALPDKTATIKLLSNVELASDSLTIGNGVTLELDLNNYSIKAPHRVLRAQDCNLTLTGTGSVEETQAAYGAITVRGSDNPDAEDFTTVTVGENVTLKGYAALFVTPHTSDPVAYGVTLHVYGTLQSLPSSQNEDSPGYGLYVNGQIQHQENCPVIFVYPGAHISGGTVYAAGYADWRFEGGTIEGTTSGIAIKSGKVSINGNTSITCTGDANVPTQGFSNGVNASGTAIQIESNSDYAGNIELLISGGEFVSKNCYTIYEYLGKGEDTAVSSIDISGGSFSGKSTYGNFCLSEELDAVKADMLSLTAGSFTHDPSPYLAPDHFVSFSGTDGFSVSRGSAAQTQDSKTYPTVQAAVDAAEAGDTVTLLSDVAVAEPVSVKKDLTFDLGGCTLSGAFQGTRTGVFQAVGCHVNIVDSKDGGSIVNTLEDKPGSVLYIKPSADAAGSVTLKNGVTLQNLSTYSTSVVAYLHNAVSNTYPAKLDVQNARLISQDGDVIRYKSSPGKPVEAEILGGEFWVAEKAASKSILDDVDSDTLDISGGVFHNWDPQADTALLAKGARLCHTLREGALVMQVVSGTPDAAVQSAFGGQTFYLLKGTDEGGQAVADLYSLQQAGLMPDGAQLTVLKDVTCAFPEGASFGSSNHPAASLGITVAQGASLSGTLPLKLADVTVSGEGDVSRFSVAPFDDTFRLSEENGLYRCRLTQSGVKATVTLSTGEVLEYSSIATAISDARTREGSTVTFYDDYETQKSIRYGLNGDADTLTLDLNGHTYRYDALTINPAFLLLSDKTLTLRNGRLEADPNALAAIATDDSSNGSRIVIESDFTVEGNSVLLVGTSPSLELFGTIDTTGTSNTSIQGNGSTTKNSSIIVIKEGARVLSDKAGIYHPQSGTLTVEGGLITGSTGIVMKSGHLEVKGGEISATGARKPYTHEPSGYISTGDAVVLEACDYPGGAPSADISGGLLSSQKAQAVVCYLKDGAQDMDNKKFVTGGEFSSDPTAYLGESLMAVPAEQEGFFGVRQSVENVVVSDGTPVVTVEPARELTQQERNALDEAAALLLPDGGTAPALFASGLVGAAGSVADTVDMQEALGKLEAAGVEVSEQTPATLFVLPYLNVKLTDLELSEGELSSLTLALDFKVKTVVSTAQTADGICTEGDPESDLNAVPLGDEPLAVSASLTLSLPLPNALAQEEGLSVFHLRSADGSEACYDALVQQQQGVDVASVVVAKGAGTLTLTPADTRSLTVTFDNGVPQQTYDVTDIGSALPEASKTGYLFRGWLFDKTGDESFETLSEALWSALFEGEAGDLTVDATASLTRRSSGGAPSGTVTPSYTVSASAGEGGSISPSGKTSVDKGDDLTFAITPDEGYVVDDVLVDGVSVGSVTSYTLRDVAKSHTISASFVPDGGESAWENPFDDVDEAAWYFDAVRYVFENGLLQGTSDTLFSPDLTTTRAMIVTVLWRMAEEPVINYAMTFDDVPEGLWYSEAVRWAAGEGIVTGYDDTRFGPNDAVTREQLAAMLYRYAVSQGRDVSVGEDTNILSYADAFSVSEYAVSALQWACGEGIVTGRDDGTLSPQDSALRSEFSAMLMRFCGVQQG